MAQHLHEAIVPSSHYQHIHKQASYNKQQLILSRRHASPLHTS